MADESTLQRASACLHLRSKGMYVTGCMNPEEEDAEIGDGYCWCNRTQGMIGPDDGLVARAACASGRPCYEAVL